ncbi:MAG: polysaccharide deacetylase family protein [Anaerolineae bacterium]|nr:polysaccharide deacetylase family protein [Anaerolineae bacterium]
MSTTCASRVEKRDWRGSLASGMRRARIAAVVALAAAVLAACGPSGAVAPTATIPPPTETAPAATPTPAPTATPLPSPAPSPTPVPSPTATATLPPTATATHTRVPAGQGNPAPVPILMYHRIIDLPDDASAAQHDYAVSPARFEEQLQYLKAQGYESVRLYDVIRYLEGAGSLPAKPMAITFDDGYRDNAEVAFPLLQRYGFIATFFINPQPIDDGYPAYMTWAQVEQMSRAGMDVESHSYSHPMLTHLSVEELLREVRKAGDAIEKHTGKRPRLFSYPYGHYNAQVVDVLRGEGYIGAVTLRSGTAQASPSAFDLARVWVRYDDTLEAFAAKLARGR